uniref:agamous-like MADS-box protein AGL27 isoform X4 n=1 Tax=Erigeron canadensis TaxID=72917 RepID=UPI001CB9C5C4|nr:agamous-like MADS-box protein AGL27 isoform X4 [Erigeron canadensis]
MGRRKLEMKRIEDKSSRQVTFSKRRSGLFKKARHLSLLCEVDIAVIVFSAGGKLYEFSAGASSSSNSVEHIISRYQKSYIEAEERTTISADKDLEFLLPCKKFQTSKELLQTVDRLVEENNSEELSVANMMQLELELDDALVQTRLRKTQLMMEYISTLQEEQRKLIEGKEEMEKQVASEKQQQHENDGGGGPNDLATNQMNSPQLFTTLQLFDG